jgi:4-hydroxybenzoate polyprenyltransferase
MIFARSTAMGFNRYADRDLDASNPRTAGRALPAGLLTTRHVLVFTIVSGLLFVASTGCFMLASGNWLPAACALPLLAFLCGYSYAKRFTALAHLWLGAALAASPVAVWVALAPPGDWRSPLLLAAAVATWVAGSGARAQ